MDGQTFRAQGSSPAIHAFALDYPHKSARILLPLRPNCAAWFDGFLRPAMSFDRPATAIYHLL
jgi:hypothetical protein